MNYRLLLTCVAFLYTGIFICADQAQQDWPGWRGPNGNGTAPGEFTKKHNFRVVWKKSLGSGYSSVSVAAGVAVTMFSDGNSDCVVAFDASDGRELWRFAVAATYEGHDGSHSGPISTPCIADNTVYAFGPKGHLIALELQTGRKIWATHLLEDHKGTIPFYGFASSPLVYGDILVVQANIDGSIVSGFDKNTGKLLWSQGKDKVQYHSPIITRLSGQTQLLCASENFLYGIETATGETLWQHNHAGGWRCANSLVIDEQKIFAQHKRNAVMAIEMGTANDSNAISSLWESRNIKNTYNASVYHDGFLYGYSGRFFTCVDSKNGEKTWRSRQPGDGFAILAGDCLVILTKKGALHTARANSQKYDKIAQRRIFKDLVWTPPSFAEGKIYARSLGEIACVEMVEIDEEETANDIIVRKKPPYIRSTFERFIKSLETQKDKEKTIAEFFAKQKELPIIEENLVHFVYRGEAQDIAIVGDIGGFRSDQPMYRVAGTNLFYFSQPLAADAGISYQFVKDFEHTILDPSNPHKVQEDREEYSWLAMPEWKSPTHLQPAAEKMRGKLETLEFSSSIHGGSRPLTVYLPTKYDAGEERYPVVYVHNGKEALDSGQWANSLDNTIANDLPPCIVVFIPNVSRAEYRRQTEQYLRMFVEEIVPLVDSRYRTKPSAEFRANVGMSRAGLIALVATWRHPEIFGSVATQSAFFSPVWEEKLKELIGKATQRPRVYLDWGKYDLRSPLQGRDLKQSNQRLAAFLKEQGYVYQGGEASSGYGWVSWRNRTDKLLQVLFDAKKDLWDQVAHHYADNDGVSIHYVTIGKGPLVVMIHGFPDFWYTWREQMPTLAEQFQVVALDLRGYNRSGRPKGVENYTMDKLVSDVVAVIKHTKNDKAIIVGHDWGGAISWALAMTKPEMVEKLIICNLPHPRGIRRELANNPQQQRNSEYARVFQQPDAHKALTPENLSEWLKDMRAKPRYIEAFQRSDYEAMLNYYKANYPRQPYQEDTTPLVKVKCPVLMIHGLQDWALLPGALNDTWQWLEKDFTLVTIPEAGHFVQQDAAEMVTRTMKMWLNR